MAAAGVVRPVANMPEQLAALHLLTQLHRAATEVGGEIDDPILIELGLLDGGLGCIRPELYIVG